MCDHEDGATWVLRVVAPSPHLGAAAEPEDIFPTPSTTMSAGAVPGDIPGLDGGGGTYTNDQNMPAWRELKAENAHAPSDLSMEVAFAECCSYIASKGLESFHELRRWIALADGHPWVRRIQVQHTHTRVQVHRI